MKNKSEIRVCKNKDCQKPLPPNYKYNKCEACRNQTTDKIKSGIKYVGGGLIALAAVVITGRKITPKE